MTTRSQMRSRPSPGRFLVFLLVVAAAFTYVALQWQAAHRAPATGSAGARPSPSSAAVSSPGAPTGASAGVSAGASAAAGVSPTAVTGTATSGAASPGVRAGVPAGAGTSPSPAAAFAAARIDRARARSRETALLQQVAADAEASPAVRQQAEQEIMNLAVREDREARAEMLLAARGYPDALVFLGPLHAVVVVRAPDLQATGAARIADAVASVTALPAEQVRILARP